MGHAEHALRTWFAEVWNKGNIDKVYPDLVHPDCVFHTVGQGGESLVGLQGFHQIYDPIQAAFREINFTVDEVVESGDVAAVRWTCTARHVGDQMGVAPSGKAVRFSGMGFAHFKDGKVTHTWDEWDRLGFMKQIGAIAS